MQITDLNDFGKRLIPLTFFRRNAGEVLEKLPELGMFILTKDGKPIAKLSDWSMEIKKDTVEEKLKKLQKLVGGFKIGENLTPNKINRLIDKSYEEMLP